MISTALPAVLMTLLALTVGCSSDETPPPVADTGSTEETPDEVGSPEDGPSESGGDPPVLDFGGASALGIPHDCDDPSPAWVSLAKSVEVTKEVRLGGVTTAGGGRLVGDVTIAPLRSGPDSGTIMVDDDPGYDDEITARPAWAERVPVQGTPVQPGRYVVFAQVKLAPTDQLERLDFAWFDSNATGSSPLVMPVELEQQTCD